jgi:hypothetical protein
MENEIKKSADNKSVERYVVLLNNEPPYYGWYKAGCDAFLNLGEMKKAVVIRKSLEGSGYFISTGSYYPFKNEVYNARFDRIDNAMELASEIIGSWFSESIKQLGI